MNAVPNNSEVNRSFLNRNHGRVEQDDSSSSRFIPWKGLVVKFVLLIVCLLLLPSARAVDGSLSKAQSNSVTPPMLHSNALVQSSLPSASSGKTNISTNEMDALDDVRKLTIGDRLSFRIVEDNEDPKEISVTDSGDLEIPYIGRYPAVGKTCKGLALALKAQLEKEYYYHATVIIAVNTWAKSQGKIYIVGPVHAPGPQEIPSDEVLTVSKAILRAGGFGDYADRHKVEVRRKPVLPGSKDQVFTVDVAQILDKGKTAGDLPLQSGDLIFVPERLVRF
jgi:polysaccharide export outer membrane protein